MVVIRALLPSRSAGGRASRNAASCAAHPVRDLARAVGRAATSPRPAGRRGARTPRATICSTSEPTYGARSVLLITSRSARAIPGPPLRGMSSPPATSITKICTSARAGEKIAVRLSPPLSTNTRSSGPVAASSSSTASRLARDVVADRRVRAAAGLHRGDPLVRQHARGAQELRVLGRVDVVGHDAEPDLVARARRTARRSGCSCRTRRVRRPRSAGHVQLAKRRSLCSRWMGAASSIATAAGAGSGPSSRGDRARRPRAISGARSASQRAVTAGSSGKQLQRRGRDGRRVVVEREQRRVLVAEAGGAAPTTPSAIGRGVPCDATR